MMTVAEEKFSDIFFVIFTASLLGSAGNVSIAWVKIKHFF